MNYKNYCYFMRCFYQIVILLHSKVFEKKQQPWGCSTNDDIAMMKAVNPLQMRTLHTPLTKIIQALNTLKSNDAQSMLGQVLPLNKQN